MGYYPCACHSEVVNVERFIERFKGGYYRAEIHFAIYYYGTQDHRPTLKEKLRHCWQILRTGKNYPDNIILDTKTAKKLAGELFELCATTNIEEEVKREKQAEELRKVSGNRQEDKAGQGGSN